MLRLRYTDRPFSNPHRQSKASLWAHYAFGKKLGGGCQRQTEGETAHHKFLKKQKRTATNDCPIRMILFSFKHKEPLSDIIQHHKQAHSHQHRCIFLQILRESGQSIRRHRFRQSIRQQIT